MSASIVHEWLEKEFADRWIGLPAGAQRLLLGRLAISGVVGGATYDALIAATALAEGATLVTADKRALATYERVGASIDFLG
jgi:predicted nucleic acid-binding protein